MSGGIQMLRSRDIKVLDIFMLNNIRFRKFFIIVSSLLLAYNSTYIINNYILYIPILQQLLGFIILTFITGFIILRILNIHNLKRSINIVFVIGLSQSFILLYGFLTNIGLTFFYIKPLNALSIIILYDIAIILLLIINYMTEKEFKSVNEYLFFKVSPGLFLLLLVPFISIFAALLMNMYNNNILELMVIFIISLIPLILIFKNINERYYPLTIFIMSISILLSINLISNNIWSFDVFHEYYLSKLSMIDQIWTFNLENSANTVLLVTILAPTYALLANMDLIWVYKILFPFLFALTPVILYEIYLKLKINDIKFNPMIALLSVCIFIFFYGFFKDLPDKQHISELFLMLIILLSIIEIRYKNVFLMLFSFALIQCK